MTSDTSTASSTLAQLRTILRVLFKRVRDFWKMMLRLAVIYKAHTFAGGMDMCFPAVFLLSEFLLAEKDLKPSRFALPKREGERQERKGRLGFSQSYSTPFPSASFCSTWFPTILLQGDQGLLHWGSEVVLMLQQGLVDPFCDSGNRKIRKMSTVSPQGN